MRFVVYGAGAVGGVLGGRLSDAGYEVVLIARGRHLDVIRRDGLRVIAPDGAQTYRVPVAAGPGEVDWRPGDVVLLTMKSMDTGPALQALAAHANSGISVVCVQNGVVNERAALRVFADVYGVCVMFPATHVTPGVVVGNAAPVPGILDIGRYPQGPDRTADRVAAALQTAGFHSQSRPDIMRWKYAKLLTNLGNAIEAICGRMDGGDARRVGDGGGRRKDADSGGELMRRIRAEGEAVLRAAGIEYASEEEDRRRRGDILQIRPIAGHDRGGGSSWQSLARRAGTVEADYLNGEIVLLGRLHGVPTPVNEYARRLVKQHARDGVPPGSLTFEQFIEQIDAGRPARDDRYTGSGG